MTQPWVTFVLTGFGMATIIAVIFFCLWLSADNQLRYLQERVERLEGHTGIPEDEYEPGWWQRAVDRLDAWVEKRLLRITPPEPLTTITPKEARQRMKDQPEPTVPSDLPFQVRSAHLTEKMRKLQRPTPYRRTHDGEGTVSKRFGDYEFSFKPTGDSDAERPDN